MQYAEVTVDSKTSLDRQIFTYSIPPELLPNIKVGILVLVPFHGRRINGVILSFKHLSAGIFKHKLKPIVKIIDPNPVLDDIRLRLARWISNYYLSPIGEVIFMMIPPVAIQQLKDLYRDNSLLKSAIADFNNENIKISDKIYTNYGRITNRYDIYIKLISKAINNDKNCIILFPNINQAREFQTKLDQQIKSVLYHSEMTKTKRYGIWDDISHGTYQVVIGTRPTVFAPLNKIGLIIIDQPENFGYKEEQSPRYHSVIVAKKLAQLTGSIFVLGSLTPSVENYYLEKNSRYKKIKNYELPTRQAPSKILGTGLGGQIIDYRLINLSQQKNKIISWELEQSIKSTLENSSKVLLFVQRKGEGSNMVCQDCGHVFKCEKCGLPFALITDYKLQIINLVCSKCNIRKIIPKFCPKCHGVKLKPFGIGTDIIKREINKLFPQIKVEIIEKDNVLNTKYQISDTNVLIATKKILDFGNLKFDLVGVINFDNLLNLPDYSIRENIYTTIVNLINMCQKEFILQTYNIENEFWNFIKAGNVNIFLENELQDRKKYGFPPFSNLIKLTYQNKDEVRCQKEVKNLGLQITNYKLQIIGAGPSFIAKIRDKFQYQILLSIKSQSQKIEFKKIAAKLPKEWKIDVDPISLL